MRLARVFWRRSRLLVAVALLIASQGLYAAADALLSLLEREAGLAPPKAFRWVDYKPPANGVEP